MIKVQISEEAFGDLQDGFLFYEAQEPGLGEYFAASLRADIEGLKVTGGIHRVVFNDYHRLLGRVFPYAIFYTFGNQGGHHLGCNRLPARSRLDPEAS